MKLPHSGAKPRVSVHKFSSCDGCQLAFLNAGLQLVELSTLVEFVHFAEAGFLDEEGVVDIAFIEGSVSTPHELERLKAIRERSGYLITLGACATAGGLQALRNGVDAEAWIGSVYASPQHIHALATCTPIADHARVDFEIWGCPVNTRQVFSAVRSLLSGAAPVSEQDKVCIECKRQQHVCVLVAKGMPCMGPVTRTGCGSICTAVERDCYACYGPAETVNTASLAARFADTLNLAPERIGQKFLFINNGAPKFQEEGRRWQERQP